MKIKSNMKLKYKDPESAEIIYKSLEIDNNGFLESELKEDEIEFKIENDKLGSFLKTADDLISNEILAENILKGQNENKESWKTF